MKFWRLPLDAASHSMPIGELHIIKDRCKGCNFCIEFCPNQVLKEASEFNKKGYHPPMVTKTGECVNCNLCEIICPEFAIYSVLKEYKELTVEDIANYSKKFEPEPSSSSGGGGA
jgi:2-oxoglutarate ferredoxin oxidoreductase subunit delta